jgi:uncharacterized membrane protein
VTSRTRTLLVVIDLVVQTLLIVVGILLVAAQSDEQIFSLMSLWCLLATLYWIGALIVVSSSVRMTPRDAAALTRLERTRAARWISITATFLTSVIGLGSAMTLLLMREDPTWGEGIKVVGVWAMAVAWMLFHWGFARIYETRYRMADSPPLVFPGDDEPRLSDFVYFSFTTATSLATSDVTVVTTRMRWTVTWHSVLAFVFNTVVLVLAVNTMIS